MDKFRESLKAIADKELEKLRGRIAADKAVAAEVAKVAKTKAGKPISSKQAGMRLTKYGEASLVNVQKAVDQGRVFLLTTATKLLGKPSNAESKLLEKLHGQKKIAKRTSLPNLLAEGQGVTKGIDYSPDVIVVLPEMESKMDEVKKLAKGRVVSLALYQSEFE